MSGISGPADGGSRMIGLLRRLIIVSVVVGSALAIIALLGGDFGRTQGKIIGTSFSVAGGSILVLACTTAWEKRRLGPLPFVGSLASAAGVALLTVAIWAEPDDETLPRVILTSFIVAGGVALLSLFELARLAARHQWLVAAARALAAIVASYSIVLVWWEDPVEWAVRLFGVSAVLLAAATISLPAMHLVVRESRAPAVGPTPGRVGFCPICGAEMESAFGEIATCPSCRTRFQVRIPLSAAGSPPQDDGEPAREAKTA